MLVFKKFEISSEATAKFNPLEKVNELIPTTLPSSSTSGPPELPGLMAVLVCTTFAL